MINKFLNVILLNYAVVLFLLCFVASAAQTQAQVVVDSRNGGGAFSNTSVTNLNWTHTVGSGANRALFVTLSLTNQVATAPICSPAPCPVTLPNVALPVFNNPTLTVTDNGVNMTLVTGISTSSPTDAAYTAIYLLLDPPTGANNIAVTFTPGFVTHAVGNSVSFKGVDQSAPTANPTNNGLAGNSPSVTVSGSGVTTNDMVLDVLASSPNAGFFLEGAGQTVCTDPMDETTCTRGRRFFFFAYDVGASSTEQGNPSGVTMSWTMSTAQRWAMSAVVVKAGAPLTAAAVSVSGRVVVGKGRGVSRARVVLTNTNTGEAQYTTTNPFGYYRFRDVSVGAAYSIEVQHKLYRFPPQVVTVLDEVENLNFTTQP